MKKSILIITASIITCLFISFAENLSASQEYDVDKMELKTIIVEGWETDPWSIKTIPSAPEAITEIKLVDGKPSDLKSNTKNKKSLGVKFRFIYQGNNSVYLKPIDKKIVRQLNQLDEQNKPKSLEVHGIELPGDVKAVSVWVLGRGNEYDLEGWIEDWKGDTNIYQFGSINFFGWKPMIIQIPPTIPQTINSYPKSKSLVFKQFVLRSNKKTSSEEVVVFFDSLKVLTDLHEPYFDGLNIDFDNTDRRKKDRIKNYESELKKQQD